MKLTIAKTEFQFSIFSITVYLFFIVLLVSLGFWQLDRSEQKAEYIKQQQLSADKTILQSLTQADLNDDRYKQVKVTGYYDSAKQFLLDNQIVNGQAGYFVMTPFKLVDSNQAVLVNRGWLALNKDRRILPVIDVDQSQRTITGTMNHFPSVGIKLAGAEIPTAGWPSVVQIVDHNVLAEKIAYPLLPFQIELNKTESDGYIREWKKKTIMSPEKHTAYAVQWFALAITLTLLFIGFSKK